MLTKILYSDNGSLVDKTAEFSDYYAGTLALTLVAAEDKIYLGSKYPFTRKFFKVTTGNALASSASVRYWDGTQWRAATNVLDSTSTAGKSLAQSGYLSWETDKRYAWKRDDTTVDGATRIAGLGGTTLYDFYWVEVSFSGDLSATLSWAGDLFCSDSELGAEYPDLLRSNVKTAFATGKTDWEEQRVIASRQVAQDLKKVWSPGADQRVLGPDQMSAATVSKTAEIIYNALDGRIDKATEARTEYARRMDPRHFTLDENANGRADAADVNRVRVVRMHR